MIRCIPRGVCSWDFLLEGEGHQAASKLNWMSEQGSISVDGIRFDVRKHGVFSGRWTLEHEGKEVASAQKSSAFRRTFEIQDPRGNLLLRAKSAWGRSFDLERSGDVIATLIPDHPLTRRATIDILSESSSTIPGDLPTLYFSFWLAVLTWRRAAQNNAGGG